MRGGGSPARPGSNGSPATRYWPSAATSGSTYEPGPANPPHSARFPTLILSPAFGPALSATNSTSVTVTSASGLPSAFARSAAATSYFAASNCARDTTTGGVRYFHAWTPRYV